MKTEKTKEFIELRLLEIDLILKAMPKLKDGDLRQPIKYSLHGERRRLRITLSRLMGFSHTLKDELKMIRDVAGACAICGSKDKPSIDHIVPICKGGHNGLDNLQVLCGPCNSKKGGKYA